MASSRLVVAHPPGYSRLVPVLAWACLALAASGCLAHERPGADAGSARDGGGLGDCGGGPACTAGNQCVCGHCLSLDLLPPACDPPCSVAQHGDFCTSEGRTCPQPGCTELVCAGGTFVSRSGACDATTEDPDAGWCECPGPPSGCIWDGTPCPCSHLSCAPVRCGREVCVEGTYCCNASCNLCAPPGADCLDVECPPDCSAMDAHSEGRCSLTPGFAWDGSACRPLSCRCVGTECDAIFATEAECLAVFGACPPTDCSPDDARGGGGCAAVLGSAFGPSGCFPISGCECVGTDCVSVVGRSQADCEAAHASCPILFL